MTALTPCSLPLFGVIAIKQNLVVCLPVLPRGQHILSLWHFPLAVLVTLCSRLTRATPARSLAISWRLARVLNPPPRTARRVSRSSSLSHAPLTTRVQGYFPAPASQHRPILVILWVYGLFPPLRPPVISWAVLGFKTGYHPGSHRGQHPLGPLGSVWSSLRSTLSSDPCGGEREEARPGVLTTTRF